MPLPAPVKYRLFPTSFNGVPVPLPIAGLRMDVMVEANPPFRPVCKTPLGAFPYVDAQDIFVAGEDYGIRCTGEGTYEANFGGGLVVGTCVLLP